MSLEKVKTLLLTILVIVSVLLTWLIWNNQPNYDWLNLKDLDNISIAKEKKVSEVVLPVKVLYHENNATVGTVHEGEISRVMKILQNWNFDVSNTKMLPKNNLYALMSGPNRIELDFPNPVPFSVYRNVFNFTNKKMPNANFDHIVLELKTGTKNSNHVYFISLETNQVFEASIDQKETQYLIKKLKDNQDLYKPYSAFPLAGNRKIYLPDASPVVNRYKYATTDIDIDKFKKALFRDPNFVKKVTDEYTNGNSLLKTDDDNQVFSFVNPGEDMSYGIMNNHLLMRAIDFINQHSGWTDHFQYFEMNEKKNEVTFKLFKNGYPVFNSDGMADIQEFWGGNEIYKYTRPYFLLSLNLPIKPAKVELDPAKQVVSRLQNDTSINMNKVEEITIGYHLSKDGNGEGILSFQPAWYYCYNGTWKKVGGDGNGLE
ncbi:YycH family regulatory protein [Heyndrickxia acidiproducens]|uniref:YycH family regulatory protein n=1 Tax=Heyndrickxia acidiproducens TaxID=1121084 RepID=UPI0003678195|nr:two-component system activity regulator YycH [Heyndrickxia acidiproducens]